MGIVQMPTPLVGQSSLLPASKKMVSTDNLTTITTAGYLNQVSIEAFPVSTGDIIEMFYNYNTVTGVGTWGQFTVSINNGVITLAVAVPPGGVTVVGTPTTGHIAQWASATSLQDGGVLGQAAAKAVSNNALATVTSVNGATVTGHLLQANDTSGTVADSGIVATNVQLKSNITAAVVPVGGTGVTYSFSVPGCTSSSICVGNLNVSSLGGANGVSVLKIITTTDLISVTFSADPTAGSTFSYILLFAAQ